MMYINALGGSAAFVAGAGVALLSTYQVPAESLYVCFIAMSFLLLAVILGCSAMALYAAKRERILVEDAVRRERVRLDDAIEQVVEHLLEERQVVRVVDRRD